MPTLPSVKNGAVQLEMTYWMSPAFLLPSGVAMKTASACFLSATLFTVATHASAYGEANSLLTEAVAGNTSSLGSIRTLYARVRLKVLPAGAPEPSVIFSTQYWWEPGLIRARQSCGRGI